MTGQNDKSTSGVQTVSPEVAGVVGGVTRRVPGPGGHPSDSMLAVYKDRFTYTFIFQDEVASIHFDTIRREIFFKGHNIRYMELQHDHLQSLWNLAEVLAHDREAKNYVSAYSETLGRVVADNKK
ncbi:MAG: hypothetical protein HYV03_07530 [Deltaproteobacteria bacterium]|nr:hypothetical protein [Deltaproteobacteria bacterium]